MTRPRAFRVGVRVPATKPVREVISTVVRAERAGFDSAWFPDSHLNYREVWTTIGAVAVSTTRIQIGPTVTNLVTRHPTVTASAARAVAELAPGRVLLGIGAGDSALGFDGMQHSGVDAIREGIAALRTLVAGGAVRYGTFEARLRDAKLSIPMYVAASGPRTLRMAGAVADGVIVTMGSLEHKLERIGEGAADAGRAEPPPAFVYTTGVVTDDLATTCRLMKPQCVRIAQLEGVELFERAGVSVRAPDHVMGAEGDVGHAADLEAASRALDDLVSDEAALWYARNRSIAGNEQEIRQRFDDLFALGVAGVTLSHLSGAELPDVLIERLGPVVASWRSTATDT